VSSAHGSAINLSVSLIMRLGSAAVAILKLILDLQRMLDLVRAAQVNWKRLRSDGGVQI
jgi:hypothetical protein